MAIMQSQQCQCCLCVVSIFSVLFGVIMTSTGVCLVLNYGIMEVDTRGLPPEWQNEEGKKIVGIILICCGIVAMGIGVAVSVLFYTVCSRPKPSSPAAGPPSQPRGGRGEGGAIPKTPGQHTPGRTARTHGKRKVSKPPRYHSSLPPHPETAELDGSRASSQLSTALAQARSQNASPGVLNASSQPPIIHVNSGPALDFMFQGGGVQREGVVSPRSEPQLPPPGDGGATLIAYSTTTQQTAPPALPGPGSAAAREYRPNPILRRIEEDPAGPRAAPALLCEGESCPSPQSRLEGGLDQTEEQDNTAFVPSCEDEESDEDISEVILPAPPSSQQDAKTLDSDIAKILT